jgi:hypothetical protein
MIEMLGEQIADAVLEALALDEEPVRSMFGTITAVATGTARVRPDSMTSGDMGPLKVVCGNAAVNDRVLCLFIPESGVWVVIAK